MSKIKNLDDLADAAKDAADRSAEYIDDSQRFVENSNRRIATMERSQVQRMTLVEFLAWEEAQPARHEFIGGEIFPVVAGIARHNRVILNLARHIGVVRYGGEEFLLILPETNLHEGTQLAERLRVAFASDTTSEATHVIQATASFGVASIDFARATDPITLTTFDFQCRRHAVRRQERRTQPGQGAAVATVLRSRGMSRLRQISSYT